MKKRPRPKPKPRKLNSRIRKTLRARAAEALQRNTELLIRRVERGRPLTAQGRAEIEAVASGHRTGEVPAYANQARLAVIIGETFNVRCQRQDIRSFQKQGMPRSDQSGNRIPVADAIEWYRKNKTLQDGQGEFSLGLTAIRAQREAVELEDARWLKEFNRGIYVKKSEAARNQAGNAKRFHQMVRRVETEPARVAQDRLRELGLNDQTIVAITAILRRVGIEIVTQIELECVKLAEEARQAEQSETRKMAESIPASPVKELQSLRVAESPPPNSPTPVKELQSLRVTESPPPNSQTLKLPNS